MLQWMMVRYTVKADRADENGGYVTRVFEQLQPEQPAGLRDASFKLDDGVSFMPLVGVDSALEQNPLPQLAAFKEFTDTIQDRCMEPPVTTGWQAGDHRAGGTAKRISDKLRTRRRVSSRGGGLTRGAASA